jgi:putative acetyltransferase
MIPAQKFYKKYGFELTDERIGETGHFNCDVLFIKDLR